MDEYENMIEPLQIAIDNGNYYIHLAYWTSALTGSSGKFNFEFINSDKKVFSKTLQLYLNNDIQITSVKLPKNWNYLHNRPGAVKIAIRWRLNESKWMNSSFLNFLDLANIVGKFNIENQTFQLDNHRWNRLNSDQKASLDLKTDSVDLEAMTVIDRATENEIILNQNCNKCLLMIKINRFNLFHISPFFKKYPKNFENDHLAYQVFFKPSRNESWIDITKSSIMEVSNDLEIDTRMKKLMLIDTDVPLHSSYIQASFFNKRIRVSLNIWKTERIEIVPSQSIIHPIQKCKETIEHDKSKNNDFNQIIKLNAFGIFKNKNDEIRTDLTKILDSKSYRSLWNIRNGYIFNIPGSEQIYLRNIDHSSVIVQAGHGLYNDNAVIDISNDYVSIEKFEKSKILMSDSSSSNIEPYLELGIVELNDNIITWDSTCHFESKSSSIYYSSTMPLDIITGNGPEQVHLSHLFPVLPTAIIIILIFIIFFIINFILKYSRRRFTKYSSNNSNRDQQMIYYNH